METIAKPINVISHVMAKKLISTEPDFCSKYKSIGIKVTKKDKEKGEVLSTVFNVCDHPTIELLNDAIMKWLFAIDEKNKQYEAKMKSIYRENLKDARQAAKLKTVKDASAVATNALDKNDDAANNIQISVAKPTEKPGSLAKINLVGLLHNEDLINSFRDGSGSTFLLLGASKSGKTYLMMKMAIMLKQMIKSLVVVLISGTYTDESAKYSALEEAIPKDSLSISDPSKINITLRMIRQIQIDTKKAKPVLVLIDDMATDKYNKDIIKLFVEDRNLNISTIFASQACKMFNKNSRSNVNYIIFGKMNTPESIEDCYDVFLRGHFSSKKIVPWVNPSGIQMDVPKYVVDYNGETTDYKKLYLDNINGKLYILSDK